ncbi:hypothetical protein [Streptomyces sp. NBC_00047]|uniref:hypothetical protein n=1 Tax=Streptomyces sp. NBC_00047 TaxID=2975627 RepID=UPI002251083C|nr:hypothetical protein [Streptomyces sp. NBC_00047]
MLVFENSTGEGAGSMDVFCGIDWAEGHHDVALVDDTGKLLANAGSTTTSTATGERGGLFRGSRRDDHSAMRPEVQTFVANGPLPDWDASEEEIDWRERQLTAISRPVTPEEAAALATCFGPDDCYGVAWTLVHLIETAPGPVPQLEDPGPEPSDWAGVLRARWGGEHPTT